MAWSYRRRIKIIPGVHLNFSKNGISTSVGVRGANMTFGKSGTYLNTSIPILGLYNRQKIPGTHLNSSPEINVPLQFPELSDNIFSADIHEISSQNMQGVKEAIILAQLQRKELKSDLLKIQTNYAITKLKLILSYLLLYGLVKKVIPTNLKLDIKAQKKAIKQTNEQIENCHVKLDIDFDPEIKEKYIKLVEAFKNLITSQKIWDVTSAHFQDRITTRSSASTIVKKTNVKFDFKTLIEIKSNFEALYFQNANGADLYFYPSFIVMYSSKTEYALIGLDEIILNSNYVRFIETGTVPRDTKIIDQTWVKVNKNGTPDKRFKENYQIPVVKYGQINLKTTTGLNEEYEFSNYEFTEQFGRAFNDYQQLIKSLEHL